MRPVQIALPRSLGVVYRGPMDPTTDLTVDAAKDETISHLREQLDAERQANRENRRIIAGLIERVPALEAPSGPRDAPKTDAEGARRGW